MTTRQNEIPEGNLKNLILEMYSKRGFDISKFLWIQKREIMTGPHGMNGTGQFYYVPVVANPEPKKEKTWFDKTWLGKKFSIDYKPEVVLLNIDLISLDELVEYSIQNKKSIENSIII